MVVQPVPPLESVTPVGSLICEPGEADPVVR